MTDRVERDVVSAYVERVVADLRRTAPSSTASP